MTSMPKTTFCWSDAWVLAATAVGGGLQGAQLKEIVAAGDLINRTLFTPRELRIAFAKLIHAGHVVQMGERYVIAGDARAAVVDALQEAFTSFSVMQFFEDFLASEPYGSADRPGDDEEWPFEQLTDAMVELACAEYRAEASKLGSEVAESARLRE